MGGVDVQRLKSAMEEAGFDQSSLARAAGCTPGAINQIALGNVSRSRYLPDIAQALGVSLRWLKGEAVSRDPEAPVIPPPPPETRHLLMPVALPSEDNLTAMFDALLSVPFPGETSDERARFLARQLPTALARLLAHVPVEDVAASIVRGQASQPPAKARPARRKESNT